MKKSRIHGSFRCCSSMTPVVRWFATTRTTNSGCSRASCRPATDVPDPVSRVSTPELAGSFPGYRGSSETTNSGPIVADVNK